MKLSEIKGLAESKGPVDRDFVVKKWDGNEGYQQGTDDVYVEPFDVLVAYEYEDLGYSDHPYGEGKARENHGSSVVVTSITANEPVVLKNNDTDKVVKTLPKGTKVQDVPGWDEDSMDFFKQKAEEDADQ